LSIEERIENERRAKRANLEEMGVEVYPTQFERTHTVSHAFETFKSRSADELEREPVRVRTAGRIVGLRSFGKAAFAHLSDGEGQLQVYVRKDTVEEPGFDVWKQLDIGDFIGVEGSLFRTKTDELTVKVENLTFLAKALKPLPEKWHGLSDVELRYRQRYLDLIANVSVRETFVRRSQMIREMRGFFDEHGYVEVETPMLQTMAGGAVARPFKTLHNALGIELYLRIAPELYLKRLVVGGMEKVYEINRNFRNEGISTRHNPEFTMLEFYEAYSDFHSMMALTEELLDRLQKTLNGGQPLVYGDHEIDLTPPYRRVSMLEAIVEGLASRGLGAGLNEADLRDRATLEAICGDVRMSVEDGTSWGKLLMNLFEEVAEPLLVQPTFVVDYPLEVSPLSKQKPNDPALVERFELFVAGMECANGFSEVNDPDDQRARFEAQLKERERGDVEAHGMDEDYVRALMHGLPPTGGEGVGIDRLAMVFTNSPSIRDVILFPHLRPEGGRDRERDLDGEGEDDGADNENERENEYETGSGEST
jgi:lysyl-tRNA synthetase class 2